KSSRRIHWRSTSARDMFTGIITDIGEVTAVEPPAHGLTRLTVRWRHGPDSLDVRAPIACTCRCLTLLARGWGNDPAWVAVEAAAETLRVTTVGSWRRGTRVNLERALKIGDELGGHIVAGHADGRAHVIAREDTPDTARLSLRSPATLARFIVPKGSVALDGV